MNNFILKNRNLIYNNISLIIIVPLLLYKSIIFIKEPRIWAEEGNIYLRAALDNGFISIFQSHQGYFSSIPNITLYISTLFNYKYIPYFTFIVSFIFWIILFIVINNINGLFQKKYLFKFYLSIGVFFILNYYQEIFMNTINLQFITPLILFGIVLYDFNSLKESRLFILFILTLICLTNGVLGIFFLPIFLYKISVLRKYKYFLLVLFVCFTTYIIIPYFTIEESKNSFNLVFRIRNNIDNLIKNKGFTNILVRFILLLSIIFSLINLKKKEWFISCILLSFSSVIIFIGLTKLSFIVFAPRYLSLIYSLFYMIFFVYILLYVRKNIFTILFIFYILLFGRTFFYHNYSYCIECNKWSDEYKKLYNNEDVNIHPLGWKISK